MLAYQVSLPTEPTLQPPNYTCLFIGFVFLIVICVYACFFTCWHVNVGAQKVQKRMSYPHILSHPVWVLRTELISSGTAANALSCWAVSPAPWILLFWRWIFLSDKWSTSLIISMEASWFLDIHIAGEQAALSSTGLSRVWLSIKAATGQGLIYWEWPHRHIQKNVSYFVLV